MSHELKTANRETFICFVSNGRPDVDNRRLAHFPGQCVKDGSATNLMSHKKIGNLMGPCKKKGVT
jgi:hypothetical protein